MHLAKWIGLEHRKEEYEKIQRKVRYFLWNRAQTEEVEEQFNKEAKKGWRFVVGAARIAQETTGSEDCKHTSGGVFVAIDNNPGSSCRSRKNGRLSRSQEMMEESPKRG